jgi:hypothetical protein
MAPVHRGQSVSAAGPFVSPTELAQKLPTSGRVLNAMLEARGLQVRVGLNWRPTPKGERYCHMAVSEYRNRDGTEKVILRWSPEVLEVLK